MQSIATETCSGRFSRDPLNKSLKPKANTAIVFPGICSHQVNPIISGSRKTIITFFCTEKPNDPESNEVNRVKSNFFIERNIQNSLVYPFN